MDQLAFQALGSESRGHAKVKGMLSCIQIPINAAGTWGRQSGILAASHTSGCHKNERLNIRQATCCVNSICWSFIVIILDLNFNCFKSYLSWL